MTNCLFCGSATGGQTTHHSCGGVMPDAAAEYPYAAADHIVRLLKRRQPQFPEELWAHLRPELAPHFEAAIALLADAGRIRLVKAKYSLAPEGRRVRRQPPVDEDIQPRLFLEPP